MIFTCAFYAHALILQNMILTRFFGMCKRKSGFSRERSTKKMEQMFAYRTAVWYNAEKASAAPRNSKEAAYAGAVENAAEDL